MFGTAAAHNASLRGGRSSGPGETLHKTKAHVCVGNMGFNYLVMPILMQSMRSQALKERRSSQCVAAKGRPPPCICRASACSFCPVAVIHAASIASGSIKTDSGKRPWAPSNETSCCFQSSCTRRLHARSLRKKHGESFAPHVWEGPTPEKPEPVVLEVSNFMWQEAIFTRWQFSEILWGKGMGFFGNLDFPPIYSKTDSGPKLQILKNLCARC